MKPLEVNLATTEKARADADIACKVIFVPKFWLEENLAKVESEKKTIEDEFSSLRSKNYKLKAKVALLRDASTKNFESAKR